MMRVALMGVTGVGLPERDPEALTVTGVVAPATVTRIASATTTAQEAAAALTTVTTMAGSATTVREDAARALTTVIVGTRASLMTGIAVTVGRETTTVVAMPPRRRRLLSPLMMSVIGVPSSFSSWPHACALKSYRHSSSRLALWSRPRS
ncbi:hypothetical protein D0866_16634 [Hortaea werneckii]|uniref:Uncharacterized protein n=1 Tax=Hortaea werneckii TaxID=91943 RepID=A0A3M6XTK8_HORWE|nr:hypothetical protein D0866_16634 [Hortaea werneckii]